MKVHLLLGTNMGCREQNLLAATGKISADIGPIARESSIYETESWGYSDADYLNQVIICDTDLSPASALERIHDIEQEMGRVRSGKGYEARPIDIDILFYEGIAMDSPTLTIPHPRIQERKFVLIPLCELNPELMHPLLGKSCRELLNECSDNCNVKIHQTK